MSAATSAMDGATHELMPQATAASRFAKLPSSFAFTDLNVARLKGAIGGGHIGYNYQFNPRWVLGLEETSRA